MLALYYESGHGYATLHTQAYNDRLMAEQTARVLKDTVRDLRARVAYLEGLGTCGAANDPAHRPECMPAAAQELYEGPHGRRVIVGRELARRRYL